jgi:4-diphosphocytidyl-2-C-methyl-D-erythritol kinase
LRPVSKLTLKSPAKVNLYLQVLCKRPDQYHDIHTLFERIDLCDTITLSLRPDAEIRFKCSHPRVPKDESNLCIRAARLLQERCRVQKGVDITLNKRIPVGAGLGGGSSNAATVFLGLNRLWKLGLTKETLVRFAKQIGCDIPFFIYDAPFALGSGRGDKIRVLKGLKGVKLWHLLVVPRIHVSTPLIYKAWDAWSTKKNDMARLTNTQLSANIYLSALKKRGLALSCKLFWNSLEPVTIKLYPEVGRVKEILSAQGAETVLMSGSGPTVFGVVASEKKALSLGRRLKKQDKSWGVFSAGTR